MQLLGPLEPDILIPTSLSGQEAIGQPYSYRIGLVSEQVGIMANQMLRQPGCIVLRRDGEVARYFAGVFRQFVADGAPRLGMAAYTATLVPRFWFLGQTVDCRIFQGKSVVEILRQMLDDAGVRSVEFRIFGDRPVLPYVTQFNETDLQFATRLMEQSGYFYFFEHAAGGETLVVADANAAFHDVAGATLRFDSAGEAEDVLHAWSRPGATAWGSVSLKDYDPGAPDAMLEATDHARDPGAGAQARDAFLWPAGSFDNRDLSARARLMVEAAEAEISQAHGSSIFRGLYAGGRFQLLDNPVGGDRGAHIVRSLHVEAVDETWSTGGASSDYRSDLACFPNAVAWRHPIATPRPAMGGVYSAIVLGPPGDEIFTDGLGRVKLRFKWDRRNEARAAQSVWARVVQPWAGGRFGGQFLPRVGAEVAVAFIDADPDRPVVLGGLYNGDQTPIYGASEPTKSGFRSRSSPDGGDGRFHEFTFDDNAGEERVYLRSQRDFTSEVLHDADCKVGRDRTRCVGNAEMVRVGGSQTVDVGQGRATIIRQGGDQLTVSRGDLSIAVSEGRVNVVAKEAITLQVGDSVVRIEPENVSISATNISITGKTKTDIQGGIVSIN